MYSEEVKRRRQSLADQLKRAIDADDVERERELEAEIKRLGDEAHAEANGKKKKEPQKRSALLADAVCILREPKWDCLAYNKRTRS